MMAASKKTSVLVADDDRVTKELLKSILRSDGYQLVAEVSNGVDAVKYYVELKPDIVLLDIMMPQMDGLTALVEIRKINPAALVLMVSANSTMDKIKEALQKGASGFLVKPFKPVNVLARMRDAGSVPLNSIPEVAAPIAESVPTPSPIV